MLCSSLMQYKIILGIMIGGSLGAVSRYLATFYIQRGLGSSLANFPLGTLTVNLVGAFLLSFLLFSDYFGLSQNWKFAIGTGFMGALTTFSTFELESFELITKGSYLLAFVNLFGSVSLGLLAIILGQKLALFLKP